MRPSIRLLVLLALLIAVPAFATDVSTLAYSGSGTSGTPWLVHVSAINALADGSKVYFPAGVYTIDGTVTIRPQWHIYGDGIQNSIIHTNQTGDAFQHAGTFNIGPYTMENYIHDFSIYCDNGSSTGAAIDDESGAYVSIERVRTQGFKYAVVFDQTETSVISECIFDSYLTAGIWLVNGNDHAGGSVSRRFTNVITIRNSQFNVAQESTAIGILDDGGGNHRIIGNNFEYGGAMMKAAGVVGLVIENNTSEGHVAVPLVLASRSQAAANVGPTKSFLITGNTFADATSAHISLEYAYGGEITNNYFTQYTCASPCVGTAIVFSGGSAAPVAHVRVQGNTKGLTNSGDWSEGGLTSAPFIGGWTNTINQNSVLQKTETYVASAASAGTVTVTPAQPAGLEGISNGTVLYCVNADGSNGEDVTVSSVNTGAGTFQVTLGTSKSANWLIFGN